MKTLFVDENGNPKTLYDILKERNERMFAELETKATEIIETSTTAKGIKAMGGRMTTCLLTFFSKIPMMSRADYVALDYESLSAYFTCYLEMLEHYNRFEIPSTKQLFCAYMGITVSKFMDLLQDNSDLDRQEKAIMINDAFNGTLFAYAESSGNDAKATIARGQIKDSGQGMVFKTEDININVANQSTSPELAMEQLQRKVAEIAQKKLGNKK